MADLKKTPAPFGFPFRVSATTYISEMNMQHPKICRTGVLSFSIASLLLAGCGGGLKLVKARGVVTYKGSPVAGANVSFLPTPAVANSPTAFGTTNDKGEFTLSTGANPGAVPGKYQVMVTAFEGERVASVGGGGVAQPSDPKEAMKQMMAQTKGGGMMPDPKTAQEKQHPSANIKKPKSRIPEKYASEKTTDLTLEVTSSGDNQFPIELKD